MTPPDLDHLETLAKAATPGPWRTDAHLSPDDVCVWAGPKGKKATHVGNLGEWVCRQVGVIVPSEVADGEYIAAANPATVLALIRELRAAQRVVRCGQAVCEAWSYDNHLSKPGTSIGYLRDALTAYDAAISANDDDDAEKEAKP